MEKTHISAGLEDVLKRLLDGKVDIETAKRELSKLDIERVSNLARLDLNRIHRTGIPEVILADGKSPEDTAKIALTMLKHQGYVLVTRVTPKHVKKLRASLPKGFELDYNPRGRTVVMKRRGLRFPKVGKVGILAAGTADIPVAEEAAVTAEVLGCEVIKAYDVGVAGIHRLFDPLKKMVDEKVSVIIAVAGMEGTLPSLVSSLVSVPVIGVPTSVGYGVGIKGVGALMTMLQSCSPKLAVVNIDNGLGAGAFAASIVRQLRDNIV